MTIHLSARLTWHDTGWDGRVCQDPLGNVYCVVHDHVRDSRNDEAEARHAGMTLADTDFRPPCSRDPGVYSATGYRIVHKDPLEWRSLPSVEEDLPAYTVSTSPYGHMFSETGTWEYDAGNQLTNLKEFFGELDEGRSLVFFYLKDGQPFLETSQRVVVGVGRLRKIGAQRYFGGPGDDQKRPYPIWSRAITQDFPAQGFRLPLQEYLRAGKDCSEILCVVPDRLTGPFSYVAEHLTDDAAVTIIEQLIESVRRVRDDGFVAGMWDQHLAWLDGVLAELWTNRGAYPGIPAVLSYLGCRSAATFHKNVLSQLNKDGKDIWDVTAAILEGRSAPEPPHAADLLRASAKWRLEPASRRELLAMLARFEVSADQVERIVHPTKRLDAGITASEEELVANPYLLPELDLGETGSDPVALETIDHGMLPGKEVAVATEAIAVDDDRRVRAILTDVLSSASGEGDTILPLDEALRRAGKRFAHERRCLPDPVRINAAMDFYSQVLTAVGAGASQALSLRSLAEDEQVVRERLKKMVERSHPASTLDWRAVLDAVLSGAHEMGSDDEERARSEKVDALRRAFAARVCVITGRAGTGKTTVARALLDCIESADGRRTSLLLAPTGKARTRLQQITGREAKTIHQLLAENDWIRFDNNFAFKREGAPGCRATTLPKRSGRMNRRIEWVTC